MRNKSISINVWVVLIFCACIFVTAFGFRNINNNVINSENQEGQLKPEDRLAIIWTSGDKEVATHMVFMYTFNSKKYKWWDDITLVVWGPSAKLLAEDKDLQDYIKRIKDAGVTLKACKGCADMYGVSDKLTELGLEVKYMGEITDYIKEGRNVLTF